MLRLGRISRRWQRVQRLSRLSTNCPPCALASPRLQGAPGPFRSFATELKSKGPTSGDTKAPGNKPYLRDASGAKIRTLLADAKRDPYESRILKGGQMKRWRLRDPARDNNYNFTAWSHHRSPFRHFRHLLLTPVSATFQRLLFPDLLAVASVAGGLTYYNTVVAPDAAIFLSSPVPMTLTSTALGLLLVFRTNSSYQRYDTARGHLGRINNNSRALARFAAVHAATGPQRERVLNLIRLFTRVLVFHLTDDGDLNELSKCVPSEEDIKETLQAEVEGLLGKGTPLSRSVLGAGNKPVKVLQLMTAAIHDMGLDPVIESRANDRITELEAALGGSERLLLTPIPTSYTRHTSRFLSFWTSCLPFALWPYFGAEGTVAASLAIAFTMLGIEDIGVTVEEPFDLLPMWRLVDAVDAACNLAEGVEGEMAASL